MGLGYKIPLERLVLVSRSIVPDERSFIPHQSDARNLISGIPSVIGLQRAWFTLWCTLLAVSMIHPKLTRTCFINAATIPPLCRYGHILPVGYQKLLINFSRASALVMPRALDFFRVSLLPFLPPTPRPSVALHLNTPLFLNRDWVIKMNFLFKYDTFSEHNKI